jgi:hypothetical protein
MALIFLLEPLFYLGCLIQETVRTLTTPREELPAGASRPAAVGRFRNRFCVVCGNTGFHHRGYSSTKRN